MLKRIRTRNVGNAGDLEIATGNGTTLITGRNGLGRTLLLDAAWRALTGRWPCEVVGDIGTGRPARPAAGAAAASIAAVEAERAGNERTHESRWRAGESGWRGPARTSRRSLVYAHDNGVVSAWIGSGRSDGPPQRVTLADGEIATRLGRGDDRYARRERVETALARWRRDDRAHGCLLAALGATAGIAGTNDTGRLAETLAAGETRGRAAARLCTLAVMLTWTALHSAARGLSAGVTLLVDDVEAHLHPVRQRLVLGGLRSLGAHLFEAPLQLIATTNAPLVLASSEPWFDPDRDRLLTLERDESGRSVTREHAYARQGRAGNWLTSEALGLESDRNVSAEHAIREAKTVVLNVHAKREDVAAADNALRAALPDDDEFWPRWRYFAEQRLGEEQAGGTAARG